jgi:Fe-S cluster assembly protein SufD
MTTEIQKNETSYQEAFREIDANRSSAPRGWLTRLRENAMHHFTEVGFPSVKDEEWKYTNVASLAKLDFNFQEQGSKVAIDLSQFTYPETANSQLVFVDGRLDSDLSDLTALPKGVVAVDLAKAVEDDRYGDIVWQHLAQNADYVANGFTALNTAFFDSGAFVFVPRGVEVETPLHLLFISSSGDKTVSFPRVLVVAEDNSGITLIESYAATSEQLYFTNSVVEIVLKDSARVKHYKVQRDSREAFHIATTAADLGRNSNYDTTTITLGAQLSRHDIAAVMDHEGAECRVDGLYLVTTGQHTDTHSVIDHRKPNCRSHQLYKGILDGKSRAVFNGKIFVRHDAQKTDAMQTNKNLLLSKEARVDTKPQLEILADDVKCAHGAAVGQIDEDELFYLGTRGIHPDLGRNLLTYGFAEEVINNITVDSIRAELDKAVLNRLNAKLEVE